MSRKTVFLTALLVVLALAGCGGGAPDVEWTLGVSGAVSNPLTLSYAELADMPQTDLSDILMEKSLGEDTTGDWSGVTLDEILSEAGAGEYVSITAVAGDGYAIEISKDELQDAIVALKENGEWIADSDPDHGPIRMVCPYTPANRWVFQLMELQVNAEAAGVPDDAAFKITGDVETEVGWTEEKIRSMDTIEAESTNKEGETSTYTGVRISDLLSKAGPNDSATTVVFVADDGYSAEAPLADIEACADCIVSFRNQGGFSIVAPGFAGNVQVKGVVEIQVK
ncbi:MAG: molybdopterin-dependent oxidoreductase [Anaerolineae bacterium]|jgi:DMSO/TMAO reductase YedYZ molybdopterin-dependent catalytic subunit